MTDFVYALFDIMQPMFVNGTCPGKPWKKRFLSPGKPWNLVFAVPGKKHFNVCTNPVENEPDTTLFVIVIFQVDLVGQFFRHVCWKRTSGSVQRVSDR